MKKIEFLYKNFDIDFFLKNIETNKEISKRKIN